MPIEARAQVSLPPQFEELTCQLLRGGEGDRGNPGSSLSSPVSICLDLPFSSSSPFFRHQGPDAERSPAVAPASEMFPGQASSCNGPLPVILNAGPFAAGATMDSASGESRAPFVLPLPSFLSPEAAAIRARELQGPPLLDTPLWAARTLPEEDDLLLPDMHQESAAAAQSIAEMRSRSVVAAAAAAARAASAATVAEAAAAVIPASEAAAPQPAAATAASTGFSHARAGRLRSAFNRVTHPRRVRPAVPEVEAQGEAEVEEGGHTMEAEVEEGGTVDTVVGGVDGMEEAPTAAQPFFESAANPHRAEPEDLGPSMPLSDIEDSAVGLLSLHRYREGFEGSKSADSPVLPSHPSLLPFE